MSDTIAIVTGASRGVGKGIAIACDHADDAQVEALFERVAHESGRLDLLVNNACHVDHRLSDPGNFWENP